MKTHQITGMISGTGSTAGSAMFITEYGAIRLYKIRWMENLAYGDSARLYLHHPLRRRDLPVIHQGEDARWGEGDVQGGLMAGLF
jgi:hypothetical protein